MSKRYSTYLPAFIYITDILILNFSILIGQFMLHGYSKITSQQLIFILLANFSWSTVSMLSKNFVLIRPLSLRSTLNKFLTTLVYHLLLVFAIIQLFGIVLISKAEILVTYLNFWIIILIGKSILLYVLDVMRKKGYNGRRIILLGNKEVCARVIRSFSNHPEYGYNIVKTIFEDELNNIGEKELHDYLSSYEPNEIYVCYKQLDQNFLNALVNFSDTYAIQLKLVSDLAIANKYTQLVDYDGIPAIIVTSVQPGDHKIIFIKRVFDVCFSLGVMIFGLPVFFTLFLVTRFTSAGPAFFKQERIGKDGKPFFIYKFRSMYVNAEKAGPQLASDYDPRITKWGLVMRQTRLDELPQFWNVLKGDMSVVGPRPERQYYIEKIMERKPVYRDLLNIKPGLTSVGQVNYGYAENIEQICDRVSHDLAYLQNMSMNYDLGIIFKTVKVMVQRKGK